MKRESQVDKDRALIDKLIDWRKVNRPYDTTAIKTNLSPEALHKALGKPAPRDGQSWPTSVLYRDQRIVSNQGVSVGA